LYGPFPNRPSASRRRAERNGRIQLAEVAARVPANPHAARCSLGAETLRMVYLELLSQSWSEPFDVFANSKRFTR
jgi:hypothetical protein